MNDKSPSRDVELPRANWSKDVHAALSRMLRDTPPGALAALDWDDTVVSGDLGLAWAAALDSLDDGGRRATWTHNMKHAGYRAACEGLALGFAGLTPLEMARLAAVEMKRPQVRPEMAQLISALHGRGWLVVIVSASPSAIVREAAAELDIDPLRVLGTELQVGPSGRYAPTLIEPAPIGAGKLAALARLRAGPIAFAAGDSRSDVPLLCAARRALLIDHGEPDVLAVARERGWCVQAGWRRVGEGERP